MTITCPQPAVPAAPATDPQLEDEMAAAAHCATLLGEAGLRIAFAGDPDRPLRIALERPEGEPLRRLTAGELLALVTLPSAELRSWADRPELPIPGRMSR